MSLFQKSEFNKALIFIWKMTCLIYYPVALFYTLYVALSNTLNMKKNITPNINITILMIKSIDNSVITNISIDISVNFILIILKFIHAQ